ncbi:hypothetical protein AZE42_11530 [Rhizopogon vesiculosus]|uniref:Uncharacterized protein n=1 Tax=Rhizopogon vesiculosus TaxID=180088 RepID=A0A1J8PP20_9AGAM|nr:hypothetical protein AZE42_11530 [Rhizopogon vesiculosus]
MGPAFEARWEEFFKHRPDKAVALFAMFSGCFGRALYGLPPRKYLGACYFTVLLPTYPRSMFLKF